MAKAPRVQPAPALPKAAPLGTPQNPISVQPAPLAPPATPNAPTPGVIDPEKNPTSNQVSSPIPSSELPTGPLPPSATTVDTRQAETDDGKGKPQTAQEAIDRLVPEGEFASNDHREKAMKKWPNLFAETAKN